jgi:hypothetical protein
MTAARAYGKSTFGPSHMPLPTDARRGGVCRLQAPAQGTHGGALAGAAASGCSRPLSVSHWRHCNMCSPYLLLKHLDETLATYV